jgi:hypothetical protein
MSEGLILGVIFVLAYVGGWHSCLRVRFWRERAVSTEEIHRERETRAQMAEERILGHLDAADDDEKIAADGSPMGAPPPMPGVVKKKKAVTRMRQRLGI